MITIRINQATEKGSGIRPRWISEQIQNRRRDNASICVVFEVNCSDVSLILPMGQCHQGNGRERKPNRKEQKLIDNFQKIKDDEINSGLIISFWQNLKKVCR
ncbi:hypothetical protein [Gracilimonas mengyeensis]|uniref:Uncharacterized protein n=1 Tax=Gracilimonas mengyeensis TaxID=1302730 RepID=A0A521D2T0_9BACT|nr:hypothetical protein [Gracilimonas mengyeensis]SMO65331.1 hypothetical protein SAMN06265219_10714 [Gracilimonas mengyeensis]